MKENFWKEAMVANADGMTRTGISQIQGLIIIHVGLFIVS